MIACSISSTIVDYYDYEYNKDSNQGQSKYSSKVNVTFYLLFLDNDKVVIKYGSKVIFLEGINFPLSFWIYCLKSSVPKTYTS